MPPRKKVVGGDPTKEALEELKTRRGKVIALKMEYEEALNQLLNAADKVVSPSPPVVADGMSTTSKRVIPLTIPGLPVNKLVTFTRDPNNPSKYNDAIRQVQVDVGENLNNICTLRIYSSHVSTNFKISKDGSSTTSFKFIKINRFDENREIDYHGMDLSSCKSIDVMLDEKNVLNVDGCIMEGGGKQPKRTR